MCSDATADQVPAEETAIDDAAGRRDMTWTSFDRYARYSAVAATMDATFGPDADALDVGDGSGYLRAFTGRSVVSIDIVPSDRPLPGTVMVHGSGLALPFRDGQFDVVISCDALEHVPDVRRPQFLDEMVRVARRGVVLAAPFNSYAVAGSELVVERYAALSTGAPQEQLYEHRTYGLPELDVTSGYLTNLGLEVAVKGNGNLQDWTILMLLKYQIAGRPALQPLGDAIDAFYNAMLRHRNDVAPFYRHIVVATKHGVPTLPPLEARPEGMADENVLPMLAALSMTTFGEVERQDVQPGLIATQTMLADLLNRSSDHAPMSAITEIEQSFERLERRLGSLEKELSNVADATDVMLDRLAVLRAESEQAIAALRHPVVTLRRRWRRRRDLLS